jgi:hypothetical protein
MKQYLFVLIAGAVLLCMSMAYGCGTTTETTAKTTPRETTAQTTLSTTEPKKPETTTARTITEPLLTNPETTDIIDPNMTLPDIDNPITDIEPNIPEEGVGDNGGIDDIFDGDMNGSGDMDTPNAGTDMGARRKNRMK